MYFLESPVVARLYTIFLALDYGCIGSRSGIWCAHSYPGFKVRDLLRTQGFAAGWHGINGALNALN